MKAFIWFVVIAMIGGIGYSIVRWRQQWAERQRASEARFTTFIAEARPAAPAAAAPTVADPQERLLLDAAAKAGEAGEPVLSIQLYAKLLSRYPRTQFESQARAGVEQQKKRLAKA